MHSRSATRKGKPVIRVGLAVLLGAFLAIQLLPHGAGRTNPPVQGEPPWDSPRTRALFYETCGDCHSHKTVWPWYSRVAPASWLVLNDVEHGREEFNVSQWGRPGKNHGKDAAEELLEGEMPPKSYLALHPSARLEGTEKEELIRGLLATFGGDTTREGRSDYWTR